MPPTPTTVLITGCSAGGLGAALALAVAKHSPAIHVFATARDRAKIPSVLSSQPNITVLQLDVTSPSSVAAAATAVAAHPLSAGRLDILVNNAGVQSAMPLLDTDVDTAKAVFETNLWGPLRMIQAFADLLIAAQGRIVNVSTMASCINLPWNGSYSASKAALNQLGETLRLERPGGGCAAGRVAVRRRRGQGGRVRDGGGGEPAPGDGRGRDGEEVGGVGAGGGGVQAEDAGVDGGEGGVGEVCEGVVAAVGGGMLR
jgi:NAD(P)-dependent dehydrogenase (short-subunit alcohol dehydrogenase family)